MARRKQEQTPPDLSEFARSTWDLGGLSPSQFLSLAALGAAGPHLRPDQVGCDVLDAMTYDPTLYNCIRIATAPAQDQELYYWKHDDPRYVAEAEAWSRPILPYLLPPAARAYAYGSVPVILDWDVSDLQTVVKDEKGPRNRNLPNHVHYSSVHEVWPADATIRVQADRLISVSYGGSEYGGEGADSLGSVRAFVAVWDMSFGRWCGNAALRRAYHDWFTGSLVRLWRARYLERSVDVPRVGFAPAGDIKIGGQTLQATALLRSILMSLRNGSTVVLPSTMDGQGKNLWSVQPMDLPDRSDVWQKAIDHYDLMKARACLIPQDMTQDDGQLHDVVQDVANFCAQFVTRVASVVHRMRYGDSVPPPILVANDVPKFKKRILKDVLARVADAKQRLANGKEYTLGELVHPEILDQLGVRARTVEEAAHEPDAGAPQQDTTQQPGRPMQQSGERQQRRDQAQTDQAQNDTGAAVDRTGQGPA